MQTRKPIVAGQFYPGQYDSCLSEINQYLKTDFSNRLLPERIVAGIVPHAGWAFSGELAAMVFSAIKERQQKVNTFVIFGAAHSYFGQNPAVFDRGSWITPLGQIAVDEELAAVVLKQMSLAGDVSAHASEHSIEVQIPFIQHLFAGAKILPIIVPPASQAIELGETLGGIISSEKNKKIVCIGSTDLTHYGPRYGFIPKGVGIDGINWAHDVNDKEFIDLALKLEPEKLFINSIENHNACGPGAAVAAIAAAKKLGKTDGLLLAQTNSNEIMQTKMGTSSTESVGYAAIVF